MNIVSVKPMMQSFVPIRLYGNNVLLTEYGSKGRY